MRRLVVDMDYLQQVGEVRVDGRVVVALVDELPPSGGWRVTDRYPSGWPRRVLLPHGEHHLPPALGHILHLLVAVHPGGLSLDELAGLARKSRGSVETSVRDLRRVLGSDLMPGERGVPGVRVADPPFRPPGQ